MPLSKRNVTSKTPVKHERSVLVISSDDESMPAPSKLTKRSVVAPKSVSGNLSAKVLVVLGSGQELTLAAPLDDEPTDKPGNNTRRQSDRIKLPSSKVKASVYLILGSCSPLTALLYSISNGTAVADIPSKRRQGASALVRPGSPSYAAVVSGALSDSHDSASKKSSVDDQSPPAPPPSKRAKLSKAGEKKVLTHGSGVVLKALKAIDSHYESVGQVSPIVLTPAAKVPADSPPPSSPPKDTPSPRKRRLIVASPSEDDEPTPKVSSSSGSRPPQTPTPASRARCNIFVDDEAEESEVDAASDEDGDAEDGEEYEEEVESEGAVSDTGSQNESDNEPSAPQGTRHLHCHRDQSPGDADEVPLEDSNETSDNDPDAQPGQDDAGSDGDGDSDDPGDLSNNSIVCRAKVHSSPWVVRMELHDPDLDQMGVYDKKPKCTYVFTTSLVSCVWFLLSVSLFRYCALVPYCERDGTVSVTDFATCKSTFTYDGVVRTCCGFLFERHGDFVNTSQCDLDMFTVPKFPIMNLADTNHMAIDIVIGVCMECSLHAVASEGLHNLHQIVIMPFGQQFLFHSGIWGNVFGFDTIVASVSAAGIAFTTQWEVVDKGEGVSKKSKSKPPPAKARPPPPPPSAGPSDCWKQQLVMEPSSSYVPAKKSKALDPNRWDRFVWAHAFEDKIPIYDGRGKKGNPDFQFTSEQFDELESLPLYPDDVPVESLVAVGTTLTLGRDGTSLYTDVQFVILLGLPKPSSAKMTKAGKASVSKGKGKKRA
ncbi:hypothetical protein ARMSODRAFT_1022743 [Armillaria solidipes]|uniref:Uncharacterized protein n=1 Tax=Armillaria solidipes TaxID=1076256 RepID=A0A2H3B5T1_9AGAR|nr:hypothetical protein ARMSODRAFT_1022743 [Armillaria solidipes]